MTPTWIPPTPSAPYRTPDEPESESPRFSWPEFIWEVIKMAAFVVGLMAVIIGIDDHVRERRRPPPRTVTIQSRNCACTCEVTR